ncbi:MAG: 3'(2'),5'-bisphosphate nucleotidase [Oceanospirillales bacterium LUC14_002_19_P2]|nr:MAG: 3'(2'),5'-bisphosphate nucleotidase [Oceanospirillales bacterium LUC14_002_19_P2]
MITDISLAQSLREICQQAGKAILAVYQRDDVGLQTKADDSPVTEADLTADRCIREGLQALTPEIPVLSEESDIVPWAERSGWKCYWLVDPLDGTREFVDRTDEFTVNIALIENGVSILGVIYAPVNGVCYMGGRDTGGAWRQCDKTEPVQLTTRPCAPEGIMNVAVSRRHGENTIPTLMQRFEHRFGEVHVTTAGSSLKACLVAEGLVDIYPRRGPTSEWDTAAAQSIVEAAGGRVLDPDLKPLRYNSKESLLNPDFTVVGDPSVNWENLLL